ncbi:hypothetical protein ACSX1A_11970 [Pontibacter sp. MBLB2868]|uniref:hypothetical protein n=1 Tax=Pontibacter sp. MBLB2868 TaxID=3451555 RepID=UPI003F7520F6
MNIFVLILIEYKNSMKKNYILGILAAVLLTSCSPTAYQVMETASADVKTNGSSYEHVGEDLVVSYNLWDETGKIRFNLYNKSDAPVYVDLDRSHLIVNGQSFDYYNDTETSTSNKSAYSRPAYLASSVKTSQVEVATKIKPKRVVEIPPHSFFSVGGLTITNGIKDCGIGKMKNGVAASESYSSENSPLQFRNFVTYSLNSDFGNPETIDNSFYVQRIVNLTWTALQGKPVKYKDCPDDNFSKQGYELPYSKPQNIRVELVKK